MLFKHILNVIINIINLIMKNFLYILVILYNLNLILNTYIEIMIKMITIFNYKNTTNFTENSFVSDIISY